ncbi:MAG: hypothetical protein GY703_09910 [Gammaproteobacteria bacterium]|nr:hypothetical protein [Gammaproteobacteria bacterium]
MYSVSRWSVRHARLFEILYSLFEPVLVRLNPVWSALGYQRVEKPVRLIEQLFKELLFDCRMCGDCILSSTGMSCSMSCPKHLRNGPCGGVRLNGNCEVQPERRCVWVDAWNGSRKMKRGDRILTIQKPMDARLQGHSSWLRQARRVGQRGRQTPGRTQ